MTHDPEKQARRLRTYFAEHGRACGKLGSPFIEQLFYAFGEDFEKGGPVHTLLHAWPTNPTKDALALRLAGALHHGVLTGAAPALAAVYPAKGRLWTMDEIWPVARDYLAANLDKVRAFIQGPPQTNEIRRPIALLPGFLEMAAAYPDKPIHLLELGASAGLNQNWDRFSYKTKSWQRTGHSDVLVETDWQGPPPVHFDIDINIASRAACDLNPLDPSNPDDALLLRSYIWPDQFDRLARFDAAVKLAIETQTKVTKQDAAIWLKERLNIRPDNGLTIIYHSVFLQYPPRAVIDDIITTIQTAGKTATTTNPLAWLCFESQGLFDRSADASIMITRLQSWPGGDVRILNRSDGHATRIEVT